MATVKAKYLGDLRLECTHLQSGTKIITDAPTDNNGKGEAFSPTDLCSTSLAACAMTIMGIGAVLNIVLDPTCPVHLSLHPDVKQNFVFNWQ